VGITAMAGIGIGNDERPIVKHRCFGAKSLPYCSATLRRLRAPRTVRGAGSSRVRSAASFAE
jgi:hypothetical protein